MTKQSLKSIEFPLCSLLKLYFFNLFFIKMRSDLQPKHSLRFPVVAIKVIVLSLNFGMNLKSQIIFQKVIFTKATQLI